MASKNPTDIRNKGGAKVPFRKIFSLYSFKRLMIFPAMALVFIAIIIVYHGLLMNYADQSIVENSELNASRTAKEIELYLSSGMDTIEEASYTLDRMLEKGASHDAVLDFLTEETNILQNTTFIETTGLYACIHDEYHDGSGWDPGPDYNPKERPWYTEAMEGNGDIVFVNPYLDLYSNEIVMTLAQRLKDGKSVIAIDITLGKLQEIIENNYNQYTNAITMVISANGMVVAHSVPGEIGKNYLEDTGSFGSKAYTTALESEETFFDFDQDNRQYTACSVEISNGWKCITVADAETVYSPAKKMVVLGISAILLTLIVFAAVMYYYGKRNYESRRLEILLKSSADIYMSLCDFDMVNNTVTEIKNVNPAISQAVKTVDHNASEVFCNVMKMLPDSPTKQMAIDFTDLSTINDRMMDKDTDVIEYYSFGGKWVRARLIVSERNEEGKILHVLWMLEDITEEKEIRDSLVDRSERAMAASEAKSAFLSNMSHEIRTPINAVLGMNEMILRESDDDHIISYANMIKSAGNSLLSLINDILDFSKIESGKMQIVPSEYDFGEFLNDIVNVIKVRIKEKGLDMKLDIDPMIPRGLFGDEVRLKQIITNILSNAAKYTEKGTVTLKAELDKVASDEYRAIITFSIKDTGVGIRKEDFEKLFKEFERIDEKKNRKIEGTGLGMAISKNLLDMMGSELKVESEYGQGSEFSFILRQGIRNSEPVGDITELFNDFARRQNNYVPMFTAENARVLVVDDLAVNLVVFKGLLKKTKITVDTASSGKDGIDLTKINKYDIIFLDHLMPEMDGIETLDAIRSDDANINRETVAVCLTANAVTGAKEFYMENGFDDYLTKPINSDQLEKMIYRYLSEKCSESY